VSHGIEALIAVMNLNTLAAELLSVNSTGLRYPTFSISM